MFLLFFSPYEMLQIYGLCFIQNCQNNKSMSTLSNIRLGVSVRKNLHVRLFYLRLIPVLSSYYLRIIPNILTPLSNGDVKKRTMQDNALGISRVFFPGSSLLIIRHFIVSAFYSRSSVTRTLMVYLPRLFRTRY